MKQTTAAGIFNRSRMTEETYRAAKGVNKSTLWQMERSPQHYQYTLTNPPKDTPAFQLGRAVHCAVLQPRKFVTGYVAAPQVDRRTKDGRAAYDSFIEQNAGKEVLTSADFDEAVRIAAAVRHDPEVMKLLEGSTTEKPLFWKDQDTGLACKCRVDAIKPGVIIDLKTTADASYKAFEREVFRYGYDVQAGHYVNAYHTITGKIPEWYFITVEKTPPYAVHIFRADAGVLDYGIYRRGQLMQRLKSCLDSKCWTGYEPSDLILPAYLE